MTTRRTRRFARLAVLATIALSMALVPSAFAEEAPVSVAAWERVSVQLGPSSHGDAPVLVITGRLPETQPLPAPVRLSIPPGLLVGWAGEVLGGPLENDPTLQPQISHTDNGYDLASFQLSQSRVGQVEIDVPQATVATASGLRSTVQWTPSDDVPLVRFGLMVPPGSDLTTLTPGTEIQPGQAGATLLFLEFENVKANQPLQLVAEYTAPAGGTGSGALPGSGGSSSASTLVLVVLAGVLVLVLVGLVRRSNTRAADADDGADDEVDDEKPQPKAVPAKIAEREAEVAARETDVADEQPEADDDEPGAEDTPRRGVNLKLVILLSMIAVFAIVAIVISSVDAPGSTRTTDTYVERTFAFGGSNAQATVPLQLTEGDPAHEAEHVFEAIAQLKGVKSASLMIFESTLVVEFDSGTTSEAQIIEALQVAGYAR